MAIPLFDKHQNELRANVSRAQNALDAYDDSVIHRLKRRVVELEEELERASLIQASAAAVAEVITDQCRHDWGDYRPTLADREARKVSESRHPSGFNLVGETGPVLHRSVDAEGFSRYSPDEMAQIREGAQAKQQLGS